MLRLEQAIEWIGRQAGWLYVVVGLLTILETLLRTLFNAPTIWSLELSILLAGTAYLLNGASFSQADGHIRIDLLYRRLSGWRKQVADAITILIAGAYLIVVIWWGIDQALPALSYGERSGSAWNSPLPIVHKVAIPVAGTLMLIALLCRPLARLFSWRASSPDKGS